MTTNEIPAAAPARTEWQKVYEAELDAFEAANLPITAGAMKIARDRADAATR